MRIKEKIIAFVCLLVLLFSVTLSVQAANKPLPRFKKSTTSRLPLGFVISARLRADRQAILISFSNLKQVSSINYLLSYQTSGQDQGAGGTIEPSGTNNLSRELVLGTCSAGVCRYHGNITNAKLEITTTFKNGKQAVKRYRIKI